MSLCSSLSSPRCFTKPTTTVSVVTSRFRASADVPDFLSADWLESRKKRPFGPRLNFSAEEAVQHQLDALKYNDQPRHDYGIEVMYRFAGFDPFERSTYFGPFFDLGQFERFRRIFHHSTYRVLLGHKDRKILSSLFVKENRFKLRIWIRGSRPEEEEIFQFTMVQPAIPWHSFIGWLAIRNRLSTQGRISSMGLLCVFCRSQLESCDHLFVECSFFLKNLATSDVFESGRSVCVFLGCCVLDMVPKKCFCASRENYHKGVLWLIRNDVRHRALSYRNEEFFAK